MMDEAPRSAAAHAVVYDEPKLVQDVLARLIGAKTLADCDDIAREFVRPVRDIVDPETLSEMKRAIGIRVSAILQDM